MHRRATSLGQLQNLFETIATGKQHPNRTVFLHDRHGHRVILGDYATAFYNVSRSKYCFTEMTHHFGSDSL